MNDIVINKIQSIQRCIERAKEEYTLAGNDFKNNYSRQDAAILNIIRACEQTIDLANYMIKNFKMGIPQDTAEVFLLLQKKGVISSDLSEKLKKMVSFRNTVVHEYQNINLDILISVINNNLKDLIEFSEAVIEYVNE